MTYLAGLLILLAGFVIVGFIIVGYLAVEAEMSARRARRIQHTAYKAAARK